MTLVITKQVRAIMRKHGKTSIWTNKLKNNRTVKCYGSAFHNSAMIVDITNSLVKQNIPHVIRYGATIDNIYLKVQSIIVEIPKE